MSEEITWDDRKIIPALKQEICLKLGDEKWNDLIIGIDIPDPDTEGKYGCKNMRVLIKRLEEMASKDTIKDILSRVRHGMTFEQIGNSREKFLECNSNIDTFLKIKRKEEEEKIKKHNIEGTKFWGDLITDEILDFLLNTEGVLTPVRKGSELHKVSFPYDMTNYFKEKDEKRKRYHYCHCLFARSSILSNDGTVSKTLCYCSMGLFKAWWEETLDVKLDGEVVKSVLGGDDICKFILYLPEDVMKKIPGGGKTNDYS